MIWKRIEIVSCMIAVGLGLPAHPVWAQAQAFAVTVEATSPALPLAPLPGVSVSLPPGQASSSGVQRPHNALQGNLVPDIPYSYFWTRQDGLHVRAEDYASHYQVSEHSPGLLGGFEQRWVDTPESRWLPRPSDQNWLLGASNWRGQLDAGTHLALGSSEIATPEWNESLRLSGISLSQSVMASRDDVAQWSYSLALGAVDQSASGAKDLRFGPTAGSLAVNYEYSPNFSVETQTEVASDLFMSSITGQYDLGQWGRWRSGVARSTQGLKQGWRYRAMADLDVAQEWSLAWVGERYTDGFMDIRRYAAGSNAAGGGRQRWSASWETERWGKWSGSFETEHNNQGTQQRRFGLNQQFWYSPNLRIGIHAQRELLSDDYDIGLRFSFPLY